jgi:UDP-glucose 4-epimerase
MLENPTFVAVLGGCGFMGSHISRALLTNGCRVRIFDKVYAERTLIEDIASSVEIFEGDSARPDDVLLALEGVDIVINLIHTTVPGSSMKDPVYDVDSNVVASVRWLSQLGRTGIRKLIYVSSGGTVYGLPQSASIGEAHPTNPISSYGITKLCIEKYVRLYAEMNGVQHLVLRPANVYGPGQRLHIGQGVIGVLANHALRSEPLEVWGTGESLRDYLYIDDFVAAVLMVMYHDGPHNVFNIGSGKGHSVLDILAVLRRELGRLPDVRYIPARQFDVPINVLDCSLIKSEVGWVPQVELREGVARVLQWLRSLKPDGT